MSNEYYKLQKVLNHGLEDRELPIIITGDFNYAPYRRRTLEHLMAFYGFKEATKSLNYTMRMPSKKFANYSLLQEIGAKLARKIFNKLKPDYTFYKNLNLIKTERIEREFSDHYPLISTFKLD